MEDLTNTQLFEIWINSSVWVKIFAKVITNFLQPNGDGNYHHLITPYQAQYRYPSSIFGLLTREHQTHCLEASSDQQIGMFRGILYNLLFEILNSRKRSVWVSSESSKVNISKQEHPMSLFVMCVLQKISKDRFKHQKDQGSSAKN